MNMKKLEMIKKIIISCNKGVIVKYIKKNNDFYIFDEIITKKEILNVLELFKDNEKVKITYII